MARQVDAAHGQRVALEDFALAVDRVVPYSHGAVVRGARDECAEFVDRDFVYRSFVPRELEGPHLRLEVPHENDPVVAACHALLHVRVEQRRCDRARVAFEGSVDDWVCEKRLESHICYI